MGVLVDDDAGLKVTVSVRSGGVPDVHPHLAVLAVRRGGEAKMKERIRPVSEGGRNERNEGRGCSLCVVVSGSVLSICDDGVVSLSSPAVVGLLEVSGELVEPESVRQVVELQKDGRDRSASPHDEGRAERKR